VQQTSSSDGVSLIVVLFKIRGTTLSDKYDVMLRNCGRIRKACLVESWKEDSKYPPISVQMNSRH